ncbi:MAG: penicillin-binding protein activator [Pseudomonadota bacterium]|jgi:outer membrane PBP1 activator LpoA protein|nr:MAG: hypothetical protein DIU56_14930 [Pseudomonadota bacterium]
MSSIQSMLRLVLVLTAAALLAGCPSLGPRGAPPPSADRAELLLRQGDYEGAARTFEALAADNTGTDRSEHQLRAARAWLLARRPEEAARVLADVGPALTEAQALERQMLGVELALARGQTQQAWQQLAAMREPAGTQDALRYYELRMRAAFASGRPADGVRAHVARERRLTNTEQRTASRRELLFELRDAAERGERIDPRAAANETVVRGWLELAPLAAAAARDPNAARPQIEAWQVRYPNHPATAVVRSELLGIAVTRDEVAGHVALLLPVTGRQAGAATIVRDGFMAAYYRTPAAARPSVRVYDTAQMSVAEAVTRATEEGAEFIVGPLTRAEVVAAAEFQIERPTILALNFLPADRVAPAGFFQFALSPEDEARQVARRVLAEGRRRGVALVPRGDWGSRVLAAFRQELEAGGGVLLSDAAFDASLTDYSDEITQVLRIADSRARHRRLESLLGTKLAFEPRRRADIEFIFAASQASTARLLRPQLRFHFAGDIATYATSDAYEPDSPANEELDGLIFPDMPWMLGGGSLVEDIRAEVNAAWPNGSRRSRLFAFGFDAYRLYEALHRGRGRPPATSIPGLTGRLTFDAEGRVHRDLDWAQLRDGQPRLLAPPIE